MINFETEYFQKMNFSKGQISQYLNSAESDLKIAENTNQPEVAFRFSYDALIKIGISLIAKEGYKTRSSAGHHFRILEKLSAILADEDINALGNKMRQERNHNLYGGGHFASQKDSSEYLKFVRNVFNQAKLKINT